MYYIEPKARGDRLTTPMKPKSIAKIVFMARCTLNKFTTINFVPSQRRPPGDNYSLRASGFHSFLIILAKIVPDTFNYSPC